MKRYDLIAIGTGSAMNIVPPFLQRNPGAKVAVIDKDQPGGICLTRGCIPTKLLVAAADVVRQVEGAHEFGISARIESVDFAAVMKRMHEHVDPEIERIRAGLSSAHELDYYHETATFTRPRRLRVGSTEIEGKKILLCTGSRPLIPPIQGLHEVEYHTTDTILGLTQRPRSMVIVGGGYIAAEFGHFFSAMGTKVTILGRNRRFLPAEEPEVSWAALSQMRNHMRIETGAEVRRVEARPDGVRVHVAAQPKGPPLAVDAECLLIASGRASTSDVLDPGKGGIQVDEAGWIRVNDYLETSQPGVYALGDATGVHQFKHKANYDSLVVWQNAFMGRKVKADYRVVPRAVFGHPEIASVGIGEQEAVRTMGKGRIRIGFYRYEDTAKGEAIGSRGHFVKVLVEAREKRILGGHIVGPHASILIQEIVNAMHAQDASTFAITQPMHIHPALPEVVDRACGALMGVDEYHAALGENGLAPG